MQYLLLFYCNTGCTNEPHRYFIHTTARQVLDFLSFRLNSIVTGKGKVHPRTGHEGPKGEQRYSSTLSLTLALDGGGWSMPCPGHFTPELETQYPLYRRLGGSQGWSGWAQKISPPLGFDPRTVQPVASRYTNWALYQLSYPSPYWNEYNLYQGMTYFLWH
jgi:hypothetical protein